MDPLISISTDYAVSCDTYLALPFDSGPALVLDCEFCLCYVHASKVASYRGEATAVPHPKPSLCRPSHTGSLGPRQREPLAQTSTPKAEDTAPGRFRENIPMLRPMSFDSSQVKLARRLGRQVRPSLLGVVVVSPTTALAASIPHWTNVYALSLVPLDLK
ncbi:hypothetical protein EVAR_21894_1 [Eumeta japonica]|uniref:Uncharacterized protein n=1 Tax=Eumeta variegata TaxID=151549 RepID=A0A4C2A8V9_EUMVA|nr:hypothetical protein EVAR_21894_1 [Eumeta japonica]